MTSRAARPAACAARRSPRSPRLATRSPSMLGKLAGDRRDDQRLAIPQQQQHVSAGTSARPRLRPARAPARGRSRRRAPGRSVWWRPARGPCARARRGGSLRLVKPRVVDRDARELGEQDDRRLVGLGERAALLLGQVEVPVGPTPTTIGTPRNVSIGGCAAGKPYERGCRADVRQPERCRVLDQLAQDAAAARVARRCRSRVASSIPSVRKRSRIAPRLAEHAERRIPGACELAAPTASTRSSTTSRSSSATTDCPMSRSSRRRRPSSPCDDGAGLTPAGT